MRHVKIKKIFTRLIGSFFLFYFTANLSAFAQSLPLYTLLYPCNVGISPAPNYGEGNSLYTSDDVVTTSTVNGENKRNHIIYTTEEISLNPNGSQETVSSMQKISSDPQQWKVFVLHSLRYFYSGNLSVHKNTSQDAVVAIKDITFEFNSESYGFQYFIDICYFSGRTNPFASDRLKNNDYLNKPLYLTITMDDLSRTVANYAISAKLTHSLIIKCDGQEVYSKEDSIISNTNSTILSDYSISSYLPKKCVMRHTFSESNLKARESPSTKLTMKINTLTGGELK